jgi:hypothetical protein
MGSPKQGTAVPAGDRTRKASSPLESRLRDVVAYNPDTAALYRRAAELVEITAVQDCRATSLWKVGGAWAVVTIDVWNSQVHVFSAEGPARDKHTRTAAYLAAKVPHEVTPPRKGTPRRAANPSATP